jgi:RNA-binding protein YhbY
LSFIDTVDHRQSQRLYLFRFSVMQRNITARGILVLSLLLSWTIATVHSFSVHTPTCTQTRQKTALSSGSSYDDDDDFLLEEMDKEPVIELDSMERTWRYANKPLLRIGSKGATLTHGNSLRQLLGDHTVVKVKINTRKFGSLQRAFEALRTLAEESGSPQNIELIQAREGDKIIMLGLPGTLEQIEKGEFPPPPPPPYMHYTSDPSK